MMNNNFDPYDALIELNARMLRLEKAHNNLARRFEKTEQDLNNTLSSLRSTQQHVLNLHQIIQSYNANKPDIDSH